MIRKGSWVALIGVTLAGCGPLAYAPESETPPETTTAIAPSSVAPATPQTCDLGELARCTVRCDASDLMSCNNLGAMYETATGVSQDLERALALYERACDGGAKAGCFNRDRLNT